MTYTLMHKNVTVADIEINDYSGEIESVKRGGVHNAAHLPVGTVNPKGSHDSKALKDWWKDRSIPASRQGISEALQAFKISSRQLLIKQCMGLSLSDHYWIRPIDSAISWSNVNFFENTFSEDVGNILFGGTANRELDLMSPDNTSDGWLKKKWVIADGKRYLVKGGSGTARQEPFNEVLAAAVMERLDIPHVPYTLMFEKDEPYSLCENLTTPQTELVSAWSIMKTQKHPNHISFYQHIMACFDTLGIANAETAIAQMLAVDYIIANEDRHYNNFGAVRNTETLEWVGIAPIYDNGTSMWFDTPTIRIGAANVEESKPFRATHSEQIKLAKSVDFIDFAKLNDIESVADEIYKQNPFIDDNRRVRLCEALAKRVKLLEKERDNRSIIKSKQPLLQQLESNKVKSAENFPRKSNDITKSNEVEH